MLSRKTKIFLGSTSLVLTGLVLVSVANGHAPVFVETVRGNSTLSASVYEEKVENKTFDTLNESFVMVGKELVTPVPMKQETVKVDDLSLSTLLNDAKQDVAKQVPEDFDFTVSFLQQEKEGLAQKLFHDDAAMERVEKFIGVVEQLKNVAVDFKGIEKSVDEKITSVENLLMTFKNELVKEDDLFASIFGSRLNRINSQLENGWRKALGKTLEEQFVKSHSTLFSPEGKVINAEICAKNALDFLKAEKHKIASGKIESIYVDAAEKVLGKLNLKGFAVEKILFEGSKDHSSPSSILVRNAETSQIFVLMLDVDDSNALNALGKGDAKEEALLGLAGSKGHMDRYVQMHKELSNVLAQYANDNNVVFLGNGNGGSNAILGAYELKNEFENAQVNVITFSAPENILDKQSVDKINAVIGQQNILNYRGQSDFVNKNIHGFEAPGVSKVSKIEEPTVFEKLSSWVDEKVTLVKNFFSGWF